MVPLAAGAGAAAGTTTAATATNLKLAVAAVLLLVAGAIAWRWTRPVDHATGPSPAAPRSRSDAVPAAAQPDAAAPAPGATTRRIVPRRAIAEADRSGSQERVIGIAVDEDTGKPLEGAVVSLFCKDAPPVETVTLADGNFALPKSSYWDPTVDRLVIVARRSCALGRAGAVSAKRTRPVESRISRNDIDFGTIPIERGAVVLGTRGGGRRSQAGQRRRALPEKKLCDALPAALGRERDGASDADGAFPLPERLESTDHTHG